MKNEIDLYAINDVFIRNSYETIYDIITIDISGSVLPPHIEETITQIEAVSMVATEYKTKAIEKLASIKQQKLKEQIENDNDLFAKLVALIDSEGMNVDFAATELYDTIWSLVVELD